MIQDRSIVRGIAVLKCRNAALSLNLMERFLMQLLSFQSNSSWPNFVKYHLFCAVYLNCSVTSKVDARPDDFPVPSNPPGRSLKCVTYLTRIIYSKIE